MNNLSAQRTMLTDVEASRLLGVTEHALRQWRRRRQGPTFVKLGRVVRYRQSDLLSFISEGERRPTCAFRRAG